MNAALKAIRGISKELDPREAGSPFSLRGSHPPIADKAGHGMTSSDAFQDAMLDLVVSELREPGASVLDLGAGAGLFSQLLTDKGFEVTSADLHPERCTVPCRAVDLNSAFSAGFDRKFDAVCIFEVLEHLENPRLALRECKNLLKPGGLLFVSTPDASGLYSRLKFAFTGEFAMFSDENYDAIGHMTPISYWQIRKMFKECALEVVRQVDYDGSAIVPRTLGDAAKLAMRALRPFLGGHVGWHVMAFACRK